MKKIQEKLQNKQILTQQEAEEMLELLLSAEINDEDKAQMLRLLSQKGETVEEIVGFIEGMRRKMVRVDFKGVAVDTCGTGGDGKGTLNISTAAALVVAGSGVAVAKHGNRSATSRCGSADVLEALGVNIMMDRNMVLRCLKEIGITFLFAPLYHPAMRVLGPIRKNFGTPTIFNMLGPFLNPVGVRHQLIGVPTINKAEKLIAVGKQLGYERLLIVSSHDGLDEVSIAAPTTVFSLHNGVVKRFEIDPKEYGFHHKSIESLRGEDPQYNAEMLDAVLKRLSFPKKRQSLIDAYTDAVVLNSAVAFMVAGRISSISEGIEVARESITSGNAYRKLEELKGVSHE